MVDRQQHFEIIAAFADGERVDTLALRAALADEAGRDYLIDLLAMREIVVEAGANQAPAGDRAARTTAAQAYGAASMSRTLTGLAAALAVAVGIGGYAIGQQQARVVPVVAHPPLESDVIVSMEPPPPPTQVIRLNSGKPNSEGR